MADPLLKTDATKDNLIEQVQDLQERMDQLERFALTEEVMTAENYGWVSSAWQKDPLRLGYSGTVSETLSDTALSSGSNNINGTAVPAGEIHVITNVSCAYLGTVSGVRLLPAVYVNSEVVYIDEHNSITSGQNYQTQGYFVLAPGDYIRLQIEGATATDDGYLKFSGFRVDIDQ